MKQVSRYFYRHQQFMVTAIMAAIVLALLAIAALVSPDVRWAIGQALGCIGPFRCVRVIP